jgi:UDP-glucuronate decarboxylase
MAVVRLPKLEGPLNLGNPDELTVAQLAHLVLELTGSNSPIEHRPLSKDDPKQRRPDISRARALLGFAPSTSLRDGLRRTISDLQTRLAARAAARSSQP